MERNYQNLVLQQDRLNEYLEQYLAENSRIKIRNDDITVAKRTIKLGYIGTDDATVILFFKKNGVTTIQFKTGKNHQLGKTLADYLYETVDLNESLSVNLSLKGVDATNICELIDDLQSTLDDKGDPEFTITTHPVSNHAIKYEVVSNHYKDRLVVTHYHTTNVLQIQGRPLFCYRNVSYSLAILLDQESLLAVISRTSDEDKLLVRQEVAKVYIEKVYQHSFSRMESVYKELLVSSYCVKLASPNLPEYSMLLYADLRVLEGVIKETLMRNGKYTDSDKLDIGFYFDCTARKCALKSEHSNDFNCENTCKALEECYQFYRQQRHSLFHMSDMAFTSRLISTLGEVMSLSADIASKIEELYKSCNKL
ncbi:MAG: hypothetical protein GQ569_06285 [Methylococcaceae bacterium]|nr:hypothetical protein [Methylococcaceae bacterium]